MEKIIAKIISGEEKGFLITNYPLKLNDQPNIYKVNDYHILTSDKTESGQPIFMHIADDHAIVFEGKFFSYKGKDIKFFKSCFFSDFKLNHETALNYIDGEIGMVIVDKTSNELYVIRDKMGQEKIYYSKLNGNISVFSRFTHLKYFDELYINSSNLAINFYNNTVTAPKTIFDGVYELPAAHYAVINRSSSLDNAHKFYWNLPEINNETEPDKQFDGLTESFIEAVGKRMTQNDVYPIMYSGGLDSSAVLFAMLKNTNADKIKLNFMVFPGYEVQNTFHDTVQKVSREFGLELFQIHVDKMQHDRFEFTQKNMVYNPIHYSSIDVFYNALIQIEQRYGIGSDIFSGESADGLFGLNATDESSFIRFTKIPWSRLILNTNYSDFKYDKSSILNNFFAQIVYPSKKIINKTSYNSLIEAVSGLLKYSKNHTELLKGIYLSPNRLPSINHQYYFNDILTKEANDEIINYFEKEFIGKTEKYFQRDGIGGANKLLSYRMESQSVDMTMKMMGKYYGLVNQFPISDSKFVERAYSNPNKFYQVNKNQRPKYPLRVVGEKLGIPEYILNKKKLFNMGEKKETYLISPEKDKKLINDITTYLSEKVFLSYVDSKYFNKNMLEKIYDDLIDKGIYTASAAQVFALENILKTFPVKGIKQV